MSAKDHSYIALAVHSTETSKTSQRLHRFHITKGILSISGICVAICVLGFLFIRTPSSVSPSGSFSFNQNSDHMLALDPAVKDTKIERPVVYELNTVAWLYELSLKYGKDITLSSIPSSEWDLIKSNYNAVNVIWLMGIWRKGRRGLEHDRTNTALLSSYAKVLPDYNTEDIVGSPYAIAEYIVDPVLGSREDVISIRKHLEALGMKVSGVENPHCITKHLTRIII